MYEGIWRNRLRQRVVVTQCEPVDGQRWTDGAHHFEDNGALLTFSHSNLDLVEYIGPLPDSSQRAPVSRPAETESTTAVAGGVSDDPGRIIFVLEERLKAANAEIERLRTELEQSQGVRTNLAAEIERLQAELKAVKADAYRQLRTLQESHEKLSDRLLAEQRGEREGFRIAISIILEARS
jgi:uncharacterized small protein (DUF1192 family)